MNPDMSLIHIKPGLVTYSSLHALLNLYSASDVIWMSKNMTLEALRLGNDV